MDYYYYKCFTDIAFCSFLVVDAISSAANLSVWTLQTLVDVHASHLGRVQTITTVAGAHETAESVGAPEK